MTENRKTAWQSLAAAEHALRFGGQVAILMKEHLHSLEDESNRDVFLETLSGLYVTLFGLHRLLIDAADAAEAAERAEFVSQFQVRPAGDATAGARGRP